jgi:hypothetical protein
MNRHKLAALTISVVITLMLVVGCESARNDNANRSSASNGNANISRGDFEKQKERFEKEARELGRKIGSGADDLWIWTKTRSALAYTEDLRDSTIDVDVENNVVTLSGTVPTEAQKAKAEQIARSIEGVANVKNEIRISPGGSNANNNAR